ncbi:chaperone NapD [Tropicimonas isoalkanivorans]|uniref:Chaperone NapD n=1 Tax=Tropicimonas isoalkanivorans TaxID=441112 RepID=A0A1I1DRK6_9RHOB|nr:chaperone NapD [Tropicimonas isoalkanivorans]SFB75183.1 periplasmic nitrate reductase chaperone NapD [Tropicimonas isoalkanivorans]
MNICGCLLHAAPGQGQTVRQTAAGMAGVEVHAVTEDERLVVVVEDTADARASEIIMALHQIPGVISLTLTYHHFEDLEDGESRPQPVSAPSTP